MSPAFTENLSRSHEFAQAGCQTLTMVRIVRSLRGFARRCVESPTAERRATRHPERASQFGRSTGFNVPPFVEDTSHALPEVTLADSSAGRRNLAADGIGPGADLLGVIPVADDGAGKQGSELLCDYGTRQISPDLSSADECSVSC